MTRDEIDRIVDRREDDGDGGSPLAWCGIVLAVAMILILAVTKGF